MSGRLTGRVLSLTEILFFLSLNRRTDEKTNIDLMEEERRAQPSHVILLLYGVHVERDGP